MFLKDNKRINLVNGMVINDVQIVLPLNAERMEELGITEVPDPVRPDDRFFWVSEDTDGQFTAIPKDRSQVNALVWSWIKAERDTRKAGGVKITVDSEDKWFHSDDASRIQQIGLVMMGDSIPADLQWKTMDGSFVTMTKALALQVFSAVAANDQAIFAVAETHRVAMEASEDPSTYNYRDGWPEIYTPA